MADMCDHNGDGSIGYRELSRVLTIDDIMDAAPDRWQYKKPLLAPKTNIGFLKPAAASTKAASHAINDRFRGDMTAAFKSIDVDGSGRLSRAEVRVTRRYVSLRAVTRRYAPLRAVSRRFAPFRAVTLLQNRYTPRVSGGERDGEVERADDAGEAQ
jgi:hypothetical protein